MPRNRSGSHIGLAGSVEGSSNNLSEAAFMGSKIFQKVDDTKCRHLSWWQRLYLHSHILRLESSLKVAYVLCVSYLKLVLLSSTFNLIRTSWKYDLDIRSHLNPVRLFCTKIKTSCVANNSDISTNPTPLIVFTILSTVMRPKFQLSSQIVSIVT